MDVSKLRTKDGREVEWRDDKRLWPRLTTEYKDYIAFASLSVWSAGVAENGNWAIKAQPAKSKDDAQRQAVAYLLSTGELVQAGPAREELLERALRECVSLTDALIVRNGSAEDKTLSDAEAVLRGENPWADEETP